jgi:zinc transporter ZupT
MGTLVGGIIVCLIALVSDNKGTNKKLIGVLQASSAGVMLYMVFLEYVLLSLT